MQVFDVIAAAQGGEAVGNLARVARIEPETAEALLQAVLPEIVAGIERNTLSRGGLADLVEALGHSHHEAMLEDPRRLFTAEAQADGNQILGHILGSKDRSRGVAYRAAQATGLGDELIKMLLPFIAQMVMGAIAKYAKGGLGDILSRLPGGGGTGPGRTPDENEGRGGGMGGGFELPRGGLEPPTGGGYPMPPIPGGPGGPAEGDDGPEERDERPRRSGRNTGGNPFPFPFPREDGQRGGFPFPWPGSGSEEPETAPRRRTGGGMGGRFELPRGGLEPPPGGGYPMPPIPGGTSSGYPGGDDTRSGSPQNAPFPLPLPRGPDNPYGDLSDILRKGAGGVAAGAGLWGVVRGILGSLLGFQSKGIMGWLVRLLLVRFGWGLVKRVLGRLVGLR